MCVFVKHTSKKQIAVPVFSGKLSGLCVGGFSSSKSPMCKTGFAGDPSSTLSLKTLKSFPDRPGASWARLLVLWLSSGLVGISFRVVVLGEGWTQASDLS